MWPSGKRAGSLFGGSWVRFLQEACDGYPHPCGGVGGWEVMERPLTLVVMGSTPDPSRFYRFTTVVPSGGFVGRIFPGTGDGWSEGLCPYGLEAVWGPFQPLGAAYKVPDNTLVYR